MGEGRRGRGWRWRWREGGGGGWCSQVCERGEVSDGHLFNVGDEVEAQGAVERGREGGREGGRRKHKSVIVYETCALPTMTHSLWSLRRPLKDPRAMVSRLLKLRSLERSKLIFNKKCQLA